MEERRSYFVLPRRGASLLAASARSSLRKRWISTVRTLVVALAIGLNVSGGVAAGIPVLDVSNLAQAALMVENLKTQIKQLRNQYDAIAGNRGLGAILNDPRRHSYLPDQWRDIYEQIKDGRMPGVSHSALQIASDEAFFGAAPGKGQQRYYDVIVANKAMAMQAYGAMLTRLNTVQRLMQQSSMTQDPAAREELQNRWAAEYTMVQVEHARLALMAQLQQVEMRLAEEQRHREFKNRFLGISKE